MTRSGLIATTCEVSAEETVSNEGFGGVLFPAPCAATHREWNQ